MLVNHVARVRCQVISKEGLYPIPYPTECSSTTDRGVIHHYSNGMRKMTSFSQALEWRCRRPILRYSASDRLRGTHWAHKGAQQGCIDATTRANKNCDATMRQIIKPARQATRPGLPNCSRAIVFVPGRRFYNHTFHIPTVLSSFESSHVRNYPLRQSVWGAKVHMLMSSGIYHQAL